jgi:SAM-dependent methyltransferase
MSDFLVNLFGWRAALLHGDPGAYSRYRWLKRRLKPGPLRTLDAGCGSGTFTMLAASLGNEGVGLTDSSFDCEKATKRAAQSNLNAQFDVVDLRRLDEQDLPPFDQIILLECVEHIINDKKLICDLASLLKPGGRFLLTTPYLHHKPYFEEWKMQTPGVECSAGHVRFGYTHEEIRELFEAAGLDVIEESYLVGFVAIQLFNLYLIGSKLNPYLAWAGTLPLRLLQVFDRPVTRLLRYPYLSIGVVGAKN